MAYGIQIFNAAGVDIVGPSQNMFAVDQFVPTSNGSKAYTLNAGESLVAIAVLTSGAGNKPILTGLSYSGGTVSWTVDGRYNNAKYMEIMVFKQGTV